MSDFTISVAGTPVPIMIGGHPGPRGEPGGNVMAIGLFDDIGSQTIAGGVDRVATSGKTDAGLGKGDYLLDATATALSAATYPRFVKATANARKARLAHEAITPEQAGWTDAETNSGQIILDAFDYQRAVGTALADGSGGVVELTPGRTYALSNLVAGATLDPVLAPNVLHGRCFLRPGNRLSGKGATLQGATQYGYALISAYSEQLSLHVVTGAMAAGSRVFQLGTVGEAAQFAVGDDVFWRLGDTTTGVDAVETPNWGWAKVTAVNAGTGQITIDRRLPRAWDGTSVSGWNTHLRRMNPLSGLVVDDVTFESPAAGQALVYGMRIYAARDVQLGKVRGKRCGAGTAVIQYAENFRIEYLEGSDNNFVPNGSLPSGGRGVSIAESTGRIEHLAVSDCYMTGAYVEFASDVSIGYFEDIVTNHDDGTGGTFRHKGIYANWGSRVRVDYGLFRGGGGNYYTHESARATDGRVTFGTCRVIDSALPYILPAPAYDCDRLELVIGGTEELYLAQKARWVEQTIFLTDGMTGASETTGRLDFGHGMVAACHAVFGGGAVAADFTSFSVGRPSLMANLVADLVPAASSDDEVNLVTAYTYGSYVAGTIHVSAGAGTNNGAYRAEVARVAIVTPAGSTLTGSGKYVRIRMLIVPNELAGEDLAYTTARIGREGAKAFLVSGTERERALASLFGGTAAFNTNAWAGLRIDNGSTGTGAATVIELRNGALGTTERALLMVGGSGYTGVPAWQDALVISSQAGLATGVVFNANATGYKWEVGANGSAFKLALSSTLLNMGAGVALAAASVQVVGTRKTGWSTATGTAERTTFATYTAPDISAAPTEAEVQAIADHVQILSRRLKALIDDLHGTAGHGLIGT